jgi:hypothetical protein
MKKKDVQKELNRLGYEVEVHDKPLTPKLPKGTKASNKGHTLKLTAERAEELRQAEIDRQTSSEPVGTVVPTQRAVSIADMIAQDKPRNYSVEEVIDAITIYVLEGTYAEAARQTGIPYQTIQDWATRKPWFNEAVNFIKNTTDTELEARMTKLVDLTTSKLVDRVEQGDVKTRITKEGEIEEYNVPLNADQLARIGAIWFDKRQIARGMNVKLAETKNTTVEDKLLSIAERMREIADNMPSGNIINVTPEKE